MEGPSYFKTIALLLLILGCTSCATFIRCHCYTSMSDKNITTNIQVSIASDTGLADLNIDVSTYEGIVTLEGCVENPTQMHIAIQKALAIPCVKQVISKLTIKKFH